MRARRATAVAACTAALMAMSATTALAGEITGNGKVLEVKGASICAFSGLDDADDDGFGRTQNWGQIPKADRDFLATIGLHPGDACNPNTGGEH